MLKIRDLTQRDPTSVKRQTESFESIHILDEVNQQFQNLPRYRMNICCFFGTKDSNPFCFKGVALFSKNSIKQNFEVTTLNHLSEKISLVNTIFLTKILDYG